MEIIHIIEASATGTLSMASLLANQQAAKKYKVEVIYSIRSETPDNISELFDSRVKLTNIQMSNFIEKILSIHRLRRHLNKNHPKNIFMHSSFAGFLGRISAIGAFPNTCFYYVPHCISFMRRDIGWFKRIVFIGFEWVASLKNSAFIACSESEYKAIVKYIPFRKCHLVENAINLDEIPAFQTRVLTERKVIITVGQIRVQKNPEQFALIASAVKARCPEVTFIWVGDGDNVSRQKLERAGVNVIGWVSKNDVWQYLNDASIYLSTAKWEGMPVSVIEASALKLPVIASNCAGNKDVVEHGKSGWLFETTEEAIDQILTVIKNPDLSSKVAEYAYITAKHRFSLERYIKEMELLTQL